MSDPTKPDAMAAALASVLRIQDLAKDLDLSDADKLSNIAIEARRAGAALIAAGFEAQ